MEIWNIPKFEIYQNPTNYTPVLVDSLSKLTLPEETALQSLSQEVLIHTFLGFQISLRQPILRGVSSLQS